jgi:hypothetical protein
VQPSSLVFVAIVVGWAVYLLPQWLRRRDAFGQSRARDRYSSTLRVLDRRVRPSVGPSTAPLLPDSSARRSAASDGSVDADGRPVSAARLAPTAAQVAARRRLLVLSLIGSLAAATWALVTVTNISWLVALLPTGLVLIDLLALMISGRRRTVRRAGLLRDQRRAAVRRVITAAPAVVVPSVPVTSAAVTSSAHSAPVVARATVSSTERPERASARVERELVVGDGTWMPVPVPPPTYTLKATAPRPEPAPLDLPAAPPPRSTEPAGQEPSDGAAVARTPRPWDDDRSFADDLDLDAVLARRRAVNG